MKKLEKTLIELIILYIDGPIGEIRDKEITDSFYRDIWHIGDHSSFMDTMFPISVNTHNKINQWKK